MITNILVHDLLEVLELYVRSLGRDFHGGPTSRTSSDAGKSLVCKALLCKDHSCSLSSVKLEIEVSTPALLW